jgi:ATP-dependent DNA helicase RecQ
LKDALAQEKTADIALSLLHSSGQLTWTDPFHYQIATTKSKADTNLEATQQMTRYLRDRRCRWVVLLEAFGFGSAAKPCRKCDRCRRK